MFAIYKYELKKILSQKYFVLGFLGLMALMIAICLTPLFTGALEQRDERSKLNGRLIDNELISEAISSDNKERYYDIESFIVGCARENQYEINVDSDKVDFDVYELRDKTIAKDKSSSRLTDEEYAYWDRKESVLEKPFTYIINDAYSETIEIGYVVNFLSVILIAIALSGIFADEKQTGADQILYATKNGRNKLYLAKIFAGISVALFLALIECLTLFGINLIVYGTSGADAMIQLTIVCSEFNMTILEADICLIVLLVFATIVYACFDMLLSRLTNSHAAASAIMIIGMFLSMFNIPEKYRLLLQAWNYVPAGHIGKWQFYEYRLLTIFGLQLNNIEASLIIWTIASVVFIIIGKVINNKYQVIGR